MARDYGQTDSRGGGCDMFHVLLPKPDGFCDACRPAPNDKRIVAAEKWMKEQHGVVAARGTKEWGDALNEWAQNVEPDEAITR